VYSIKRRTSSFNTQRVDHLYHEPHEQDVRFFMHYGDLTGGPAQVVRSPTRRTHDGLRERRTG